MANDRATPISCKMPIFDSIFVEVVCAEDRKFRICLQWVNTLHERKQPNRKFRTAVISEICSDFFSVFNAYSTHAKDCVKDSSNVYTKQDLVETKSQSYQSCPVIPEIFSSASLNPCTKPCRKEPPSGPQEESPDPLIPVQRY